MTATPYIGVIARQLVITSYSREAMGRLLLSAAAITMLCGYCVRPIELEPEHEPRRPVAELSMTPEHPGHT